MSLAGTLTGDPTLPSPGLLPRPTAGRGRQGPQGAGRRPAGGPGRDRQAAQGHWRPDQDRRRTPRPASSRFAVSGPWSRRSCSARSGTSPGSRPSTTSRPTTARPHDVGIRRGRPSLREPPREPAPQPCLAHSRDRAVAVRLRRPALLPAQDRRRQDPKEACRCLKRRISDAIYDQHITDAAQAGEAGPGRADGGRLRRSARPTQPRRSALRSPQPGPRAQNRPPRAS